MNKILTWSISAALAGFLFGFDTVVISGADKQLQALWDTSDAFHGSVVMAMALWGTVVGAIFGGIPTNKIGRKNTLMIPATVLTANKAAKSSLPAALPKTTAARHKATRLLRFTTADSRVR